MLKITRRTATFDDVLQMKKIMPASKWRRKSKGINFSAEFGSAGSSIGTQLREHYQFTLDDCDESIESLNLENAYNQALQNNKRNETSEIIKYNIVGNAFRDLFFKSYPSLLKRINRETAFARKHGYTRSWVGPVRHAPEYRYVKYGKNGGLSGADKKLYSRMFRHLDNDSVNTSIQTAEVQHAMGDIDTIAQNMYDWNLKSFIFNYVHDSLQMCIYRKELDLVLALCNFCAQRIRNPSYNIPVFLDAEISDFSKGDYYKHGKEVNIEDKDLEKELRLWNEMNNTNYKFVNYYGDFLKNCSEFTYLRNF
jgi:hypothetical protein